MKVVHISTYPGGGAGIAAQRLHKALLDIGIDSHFLTLHPGGDVANHEVYTHKPSLWDRLEYRLSGHKRDAENDRLKKALKPGYDWFSTPTSSLRAENLELLQTADIINLHWVSDFIHWPSFFAKLPGKQIVWTLHDQNPFTGGCHYSDGCVQYFSVCKNCPQLAEEYSRSVNRLFSTKQQSLNNVKDGHLRFVAPSTWMNNACQSSELGRRFGASVIPNGIPTELFLAKGENLRHEYGIGSTEATLLFVADDLANKRKGYVDLLDNLTVVAKTRSITCITIGKPNGEELLPQGIRLISLGRVTDPKRMAAAYRSADAFVIPSREDNLPNTILESLACGTPVVGYDIGGIPDMVIDGDNGILCPGYNRASLAAGIQSALVKSWDRNRISQDTHSRFADRMQANAYAALYAEMLGGN